MLKRYAKLVFYSVIFALFIMLFSNILNAITIQGTLFVGITLPLIIIQLSIYTYSGFRSLLQSLNYSIWVDYRLTISVETIKEFIIENTTILYTKNRYQLNVIRC